MSGENREPGLQEAFITETGTVWKRTLGTDGKMYHFRDGVPKKEQQFKSVPHGSKAQIGLNARIAVPVKPGSGNYKRVEVNQQFVSSLGSNLAIYRAQQDPNMNTDLDITYDTIEIEGQEYSIEEIARLNTRITELHGEEYVMRYA